MSPTLTVGPWTPGPARQALCRQDAIDVEQGRRRVRRTVENDDFAGFTRRVLAAHGRRIATGDVEGLADLLDLSDALADATNTAVTGLRAAGFSWGEIATRLGITRQAAQQRWGTAS